MPALPEIGSIAAMIVNIIASTGIIAVNKMLMKQLPSPPLLAGFHAITTWILLKGKGIQPTEGKHALMALLASVAVSSLLLSNWNLALNPISIFQASRIMTTPVTFFAENAWLGTQHQAIIYPPLIAVCVGVAMSMPADTWSMEASTSKSITSLGLLLAVASCIIGALGVMQSAYIQKREGVSGHGPLLAMQPWTALFCLMVFGVQQAPAAASGTVSVLSEVTTGTLQLLLVSCLFAAAINFTSFMIIGRFSALTYQMLGHAKVLLVSLTGYLIFAEDMTRTQVLGLALVLTGLCSYSYLKMQHPPAPSPGGSAPTGMTPEGATAGVLDRKSENTPVIPAVKDEV